MCAPNRIPVKTQKALLSPFTGEDARLWWVEDQRLTPRLQVDTQGCQVLGLGVMATLPPCVSPCAPTRIINPGEKTQGQTSPMPAAHGPAYQF